MEKCLIQGYEGSFHESAMRQYFGNSTYTAVPCDSFDILARGLDEGIAPIALMAIENSIAGSILQNYRILREHELEIVGEQYLRIQHQLMALPGQKIEDIKTVISHPMALNQCLDFLNEHPGIERREFSDTALAAKVIAENQSEGKAAIASKLAAEIYGLEILAPNIETVKSNYTRFFVVQKKKGNLNLYINKASIYIKVRHTQGSLLRVLSIINDKGINLSKLQSFPVLGALHQYYFYLDLEFTDLSQYHKCIQLIKEECIACEIMGEYTNKKDRLMDDHSLLKEKEVV